MKRVFITMTLLLFCHAVPALTSASQGIVRSVDDVLLRVKERQETLTTFIAGFKQVQQNRLFDRPQVSEGTLFFHRGEGLLMKMTLPEAFLVLITDDKMIMGVPGSPSYRQKTLPGRGAFFKETMGMGRSIDELKNQYEIRMTAAAGEDTCELELKPLGKSRRMPFAVIRATINTRQWLPEIIRLEEADGDVTTFRLRFTSINQSLPEHVFDIPLPDNRTVPPGSSHDVK